MINLPPVQPSSDLLIFTNLHLSLQRAHLRRPDLHRRHQLPVHRPGTGLCQQPLCEVHTQAGRVQPLRGPAGLLRPALPHLGGGRLRRGRQPVRPGGAAGRPPEDNSLRLPHVQPGSGRPVHGPLPGSHRPGRLALAPRVLQPRHRVADGAWLQRRRLYECIRQRAVGVHTDNCQPGAPTHHLQRYAGRQEAAPAPCGASNGSRMGFLPGGGPAPPGGREQLQQGERLPADGHRVGRLAGLRGVCARPQRARFPGGVLLLRAHLPERAPARAAEPPSPRGGHQDGQADGRARLHRLHVHGAHLLLCHLGGTTCAPHQRVALQDPAGPLLSHQLLLQPLLVHAVHAGLQEGRAPAAVALPPRLGPLQVTWSRPGREVRGENIRRRAAFTQLLRLSHQGLLPRQSSNVTQGFSRECEGNLRNRRLKKKRTKSQHSFRNLGRAAEIVGLLCDRRQTGFDPGCCTKSEFHQAGLMELKVKMAGATASVLYTQR